MGKAFGRWITEIFFILFMAVFLEPYLLERKTMKDLENMERDLLFFQEFAEGKAFFDRFYLEKMEELKGIYEEGLLEARMKSREYEDYMTLWIHEVKSPLSAIRLMLDNHPGETSQRVERELFRMEQAMDQALYYARVQSPREDFILRTLTLEEVVNSVLRENASPLIEKKVHIRRENLDIEAYGDSKWLHFLLQQLLNNALQYTQENPEFVFCGKAREEDVVLMFRDNGIGISKKDLPRIFQKGYTGQHGRTRQRSTGMGLYLCQRICERLGMKIRIESREGEYTEVFLYLPKEKEIIKKEA